MRILQNLTYRAFYISTIKNKKKSKKKSKKYLNVNERINFINKCIYKYYNNDSSNNNNYLNLKIKSMNDYKCFLNIYYNLLYSSHIDLSKCSLLKQYKLDLYRLIKIDNNFFENVKINDYFFFYFDQEIQFAYFYKFIKSNDKIKILYLIF